MGKARGRTSSGGGKERKRKGRWKEKIAAERRGAWRAEGADGRCGVGGEVSACGDGGALPEMDCRGTFGHRDYLVVE